MDAQKNDNQTPVPAEEESVFLIENAQVGQRLDRFLTNVLPEVSRAEVQRLIELPPEDANGVRIQERREKSGYKLRAGDRISVRRPAPRLWEVAAEDIPIPILFEDADLLVIDKPRGMTVHPAPGSPQGTLVNAILAHTEDLSGVGGDLRPGIVHRLDKDTGGLLMIAKNDIAHRALQSQIQSRTAERRYQALVWSVPRFEHATIDAPIGRHPGDPTRMAVVTDPHHKARDARTELFVRAAFNGAFSLLEAKLHTGRTHQIRVHCAYIHHPVVGDPVYGGTRKLAANAFAAPQRDAIQKAIEALGGQALHAFSLAFDHPRTGERLSFASPLPPPMQAALNLLHAACE